MNKLSEQTSPYLLQHADNPVHWMPWGQEALALAREQDKPILLSVGYSACHWCHVMAHESFEDPDTAELMNQLYINIKVDREERPDLDKIYQTAHSVLTERPGGWPLTVFLDPADQMPIFAGTYFPQQPRHGLPSFTQLLQHIDEIYRTRKQDIARQGESVRQILDNGALHVANPRAELNAMTLDIARNQIEQQFDARDGGFSPAPKFPHPAILERSLRHWYRSARNGKADARILHTALFSLERMSEGGLFDHLGGGFYRYSTDDKWMIPHFEKMLYDNGPLLSLDTDAWCISGDDLYRYAASETAHWVMREMQSAEGGYYSAIDADSEGVEGKFYVWQKQEIEQALPADNQKAFSMRFGLDQPANFEGHWHLHGYICESAIAEKFEIDQDDCHQLLESCRKQLFQLREQRVRPGVDDKILTSWNALMIMGMAHAGRQLREPAFIESAERAANFIMHTLWDGERLSATTRGGHTHLNAYLDDYAYLLAALLELLQCRWSDELYIWALNIADTILDRFEDKASGGFFFTSHDHEQLIQRSKSFADEATPSGSGVATMALQQLGFLSANNRYLNAAERSLQASWQAINQHAISHCTMLNALEQYLDPPQIIILRYNTDDADAWLDTVTGRYLPNILLFSFSESETATPHEVIRDKPLIGDVCAYVCEGSTCLPPLLSLDAFRAYINQLAFSLNLV